MSARLRPLGLVVLAVLAAACQDREAKPPPAITSQGFEMAEPREGLPGAFSDVRLRIEAPAGIEHLVVAERSYEIDLAHSPDASQLPMFGIERRVWSKHDVTLDVAGYVNHKIRRPGAYVLTLEVTDRAGRSAKATLQVAVSPPTAPAQPEDRAGGDEAPEPEPGESDAATSAVPTASRPSDASHDTADGGPLGVERSFRLERVGRGPVRGDDRLGLTWKTVDPLSVVIRMSGREGTTGRFARLDPASYHELETEQSLTRALEERELAEMLEIATANGAAAGTVFALVYPDERYLLLAEHSSTSLSELGTTVTLSGRYRH